MSWQFSSFIVDTVGIILAKHQEFQNHISMWMCLVQQNQKVVENLSPENLQSQTENKYKLIT